MAPEERSQDLWDRFLNWLDRAAKWPERAPLDRRLLLLTASLAVILVLVLLISNLVWRDDIPRSAIAAVALGMIVLTALWLFGTQGSKTALSILAALGAILVAGGAALDLGEVLDDGPPTPNALIDCPDLPDQRDFDGRVAPTQFGYAQLRNGPTLSSEVLVRYPSGCELAFDGYCLGEPKDDWRFDVHDPVWFRVASGRPGYVASADLISGPAGGNVDPVSCPEGRLGPGPPEITAPLRKKLEGPVEIAASAPRAIQVGFAIYYEDTPGSPMSATWHQIGVDVNTGDGVTSSWDSRSVPGQSQSRAASVTLLAVPCMGLEFPSELVDQRSYIVANRAAKTAPPLVPSSDSLRGARQTACDNIER